MPNLRVFALPDAIEPDALGGRSALVVDVLRATTTIIHALAAGAREVVPCLEIDEARGAASSFAAGEVLLAGERGGLPIEGFDLGNSPAEFTPATVGGKAIVLTTTNGTRALLCCQTAREIAVGAFVNLAAVCEQLIRGAANADVVCAGTDRQETQEDLLFAGAVAERLGGVGWRLNETAIQARELYRNVMGDATGAELIERLVVALGASRGGQNLIEIGMAGDIALAAQIDRFEIVPRYDAAAGRVVVR